MFFYICLGIPTVPVHRQLPSTAHLATKPVGLATRKG